MQNIKSYPSEFVMKIVSNNYLTLCSASAFMNYSFGTPRHDFDYFFVTSGQKFSLTSLRRTWKSCLDFCFRLDILLVSYAYKYSKGLRSEDQAIHGRALTRFTLRYGIITAAYFWGPRRGAKLCSSRFTINSLSGLGFNPEWSPALRWWWLGQ